MRTIHVMDLVAYAITCTVPWFDHDAAKPCAWITIDGELHVIVLRLMNCVTLRVMRLHTPIPVIVTTGIDHERVTDNGAARFTLWWYHCVPQPDAAMPFLSQPQTLQV